MLFFVYKNATFLENKEYIFLNLYNMYMFWRFSKMKPITYPIHQLSNHPIPNFGLCISGSIFSIPHYFQLVFEAAVLRYLRSQIYTVTFIAFIVYKKVGILFQHYVWRFLKDTDKNRKHCREQGFHTGLTSLGTRQGLGFKQIISS